MIYVVTGPQGSGKTTLARHILASLSRDLHSREPLVVQLRNLQGPFALAPLYDGPRPLLIEADLHDDDEGLWAALARTFCSGAIEVNAKGKPRLLMAPPPIAVASDSVPPGLSGDRRFKIVRLD